MLNVDGPSLTVWNPRVPRDGLRNKICTLDMMAQIQLLSFSFLSAISAR